MLNNFGTLKLLIVIIFGGLYMNLIILCEPILFLIGMCNFSMHILCMNNIKAI